MQPGDLLYIPRGWAHQAVAMEGAEDEATTSGRDLAAVATFQAAMESDRAAAGTAGTSLVHPLCARAACSVHVTVGLEVDEDCSWAALLHLAVAAAATPLYNITPRGPASPHPPESTASVAVDIGEAGGEQQPSSLGSLSLACQALLHGWLAQTTREEPLLRKACPLLAPLETQRHLLEGLLVELQLPGPRGAAEAATVGPSSEEGPSISHQSPLLLRCWGLLVRRSFGTFTLQVAQEQAVRHLDNTRNAAAVGDALKSGRDSEGDSLIHNSCLEAVAWRPWLREISGEAVKNYSSGNSSISSCKPLEEEEEVEEEELQSASLMLAQAITKGDDGGNGPSSLAAGGDIRALLSSELEGIVLRMGGAKCMREAHAAWKRVMGRRVEAAKEYERAMQALQVPVAALHLN